ncbi:hypothetical protein HOU02_gp438 [Caulobacter phage CcrBL9]|uniref:Uncharacterized protein n=1 Tax=Caulobacter phage CcrBL9 TaxID=2283270 RepID=A0A385EEQ3_9CAUD|nr:hypothetical protein HOU02_gp438 [Caulobacter phage CcrBL9]AXQ69287.1 hypothetical protein CcrBL9_gp263c [Caulobacter phage CcrBL9]
MTEHVLTAVPAIFSPVLIKGGKQQKLHRYAVSVDGAVIGWVGQRMERQEKGIPGQRVIASSWDSMRWYYESVAHGPGKRFGGYYTRKEALRGLDQNIRVR